MQGYKRIFDEAEAKLKWKEAMLSMPAPEVDDPCDLPADSLCRCAPFPASVLAPDGTCHLGAA